MANSNSLSGQDDFPGVEKVICLHVVASLNRLPMLLIWYMFLMMDSADCRCSVWFLTKFTLDCVFGNKRERSGLFAITSAIGL